ncbi:hypothetical protein D3C76_1617590 [compost metagenome]
MTERLAGVASGITEQAKPIEHLSMRRVLLQIARTRRLGLSAAACISQPGNVRQ